MGARLDEVGLILGDPAGLVLRRDDGGVWRLDGPANLRLHIGRRVVIGGYRSGFDRIDVEMIEGQAVRRGLAVRLLDNALVLFIILGAVLQAIVAFAEW